jgi:PAS domain S-box-containing protein
VAAARLERLQRVTEALSEAITPPDVARIIIEQMIEALAADQVVLSVACADNPAMLEVMSVRGVRPERMAPGKRFSQDLEVPGAQAYRTRTPVWAHSREELVTQFPKLALTPEDQTQASATLPLLARGRALGVIGFGFHAPRTFSAEERNLLQSLARQSALALERALLYEAERSAREALHEAHHTLQALIHASPAAMMLVEQDGTVRLWNPAAERIFGWRAEEVLGRVLPTVPEDRREEFHDNLARLARGESLLAVETLRQRRNGSLIHVSVWATTVRITGQQPQALCIIVDISERKRAEQARRFLEEASAALASSLEHEVGLERLAQLAVPAYADGCYIYRVEEDGAVSCVAAACTEGHPPLDRVPRTLLPESSALARVLTSGQPELCLDHVPEPSSPQGPPPMPCELAGRSYLCVPLQVRGQVLGALSFISSRSNYDAQDLELVQELARRASLALDNARLYREARNAIRLREEFLSIASHELKTPTTTLQLHVQSLLGALARNPAALAPERLRHSLETVERQVKRQTKLVNEMLDVSRLSAGRLELDLEPLDLTALVREVAERFEPELARCGSPLTLHAPTPVIGRWDRSRLDQVVTNLISNAVKYGQGNPIVLSCEQAEGRARITVQDKGIGISPEHMARVFGRFERAVSERHYGGFGLGLWIARQLVEALGGRITVASELGVGSTFTVELPCAQP